MQNDLENEEIEVTETGDLEELDYDQLLEVAKKASKDVLTLNAQRKAQKAKLEKKNEIKSKQPIEETDDIKATVQELKLESQKRQFGYLHGLSPEETDHVFRINQNPTKELLDDPFIRGGLEAVKAKNKIQNATPSSSSVSSKKVDGKTWAEMTTEERKANFNKFTIKK